MAMKNFEKNEYPKYRVLHYFESQDVILSNGLTTGKFSDELLQYVDSFCWAYSNGEWKCKEFNGGKNFYFEFMKYLESIGVDVKFKPIK